MGNTPVQRVAEWWDGCGQEMGMLVDSTRREIVTKKMKTIGFDFKNNRLAIVTHDRTIYFVDLPKEQTRYIEEAECRFY